MIDFNEKEKEKLLNKFWEKLSEEEKFKYVDAPKLMAKKPKKHK
jgi:hypothetical protein